ncbi:RNA polymerase ECF family sigma subunit [Hoeflea halophila]|uniref:RNA polymerase ECF family sigma subunit n=1 Tax=Hoeflea halophila TaxID=714899 RepID=A0A286IBC4_9HYPH|nr:RNA polymerase sigma factor [Hoeflea halophila]SOE17371.1 RNA polymerase ECF family sigma subunit [Hoeflea halophila]
MASECSRHDSSARKALEALARADTGRLLGALLRDVRDFQLAEDCLQDAMESAMAHWSRNGLPGAPAGWVLQTARRKAIDRFRRTRNFERKAEEYGRLIELDQQAVDSDEPPAIPDERLRLIFTCCHPALDRKTCVALTLRTLCGLTTREIARAFVDTPETMGQRLVRARHKITKAGIPFEIPEPEDWTERLNSVLSVIYLIFNEGYSATEGTELLRQDLCLEAIRLGRLMLELVSGNAECEGLLALMLLNHARAAARLDEDGRMVPLDQQNRGLWHREKIEEGSRILDRALERGHPGLFQSQAAISALHAQAASHAETDWQQIVLLYESMHRLADNPVYLLNRAVALSYARSADQALDALAMISSALDGYQPFHAAKADLQRRTGRHEAARQSYRRAIELSGNDSERQFLASRIAALDQAAEIAPAASPAPQSC